ncbi:DUF1573 domain-containing protein [Alloprevotella sp. Lung230]|uniref:DUF1573 domain-containing protein n=1 Tax=Alloprevotella sp. Lung230 TaxID=2766595 RepID=UPI000F11016A|nr:DUF1573 domain-containing protein [Alloprevotella sp. Lung230]MBC8626400.1 DUF1573 domain-containing protein [Alloprevotella sp. Lung230]RKV71936.1 MAG: DUF1573 domain-containing protein [Alloprevotella sp.]
MTPTHRLSIALLLSVFALTTLAQGKAELLNPQVDLGEVGWKTPAAATFQLKNVGNTPLTITAVEGDCRCASFHWERNAIAPGRTTTITAHYDAATLGHFVQQVRFVTSASAQPLWGKLQGRVVNKLQDEAVRFPYAIGDVRLSTDNIEFDAYRGQQLQRTLFVLNNGKANYMPALLHLPKYLTAYAEPEVVRPGKVGKITLNLNTNEVHDIGLTQTSIYLARYAGDHVGKHNELDLSVTLLPPVEQTRLENAPVAQIDTLIDLGSFNGKSKLKGELILSNQGHAPLVVKTLQVYNPGISVSLSKSVIRPGERAKLKLTASAQSDFFRGRRLLLITNDPKNTKIIVHVLMKK